MKVIYLGGLTMQIIILGAGKVGKTLTQHLIKEDHDIIIIDLEPNKIEAIVNQYDVLGVSGNGASFEILQEAGVEETDVIISVTASDELNILAGMMAKRMGAKYSIARVRNPDYLKQSQYMREQFGLSMIVNPEWEGANEIRRILSFPSAIKVDPFAGGKIEIAEFRLQKDTKLDGITLHQLPNASKTNVLICTVRRKEEVIIPDGDFRLQAKDRIYVVGLHQDLVRFCHDINLITRKIKTVMILGGGKVAYYLAQQLAIHGMRVKIIEHNTKRCQQLSRKLPQVTIIEGDGSDEEILLEEGLENTDAFVALTGLDEENIVVSLYAKQQKVKKTVAKVTRMNYTGLVDTIDIDSIVSPKSIIASHIIRYIRSKDNKDDDTSIKTLHKMVNGEVEAIEFCVTEKAILANQKVADLQVKDNILLAAITRGNKFLIPRGDTTIHVKDHVIIITKDQQIKDINDIIRR